MQCFNNPCCFSFHWRTRIVLFLPLEPQKCSFSSIGALLARPSSPKCSFSSIGAPEVFFFFHWTHGSLPEPPSDPLRPLFRATRAPTAVLFRAPNPPAARLSHSKQDQHPKQGLPVRDRRTTCACNLWLGAHQSNIEGCGSLGGQRSAKP